MPPSQAELALGCTGMSLPTSMTTYSTLHRFVYVLAILATVSLNFMRARLESARLTKSFVQLVASQATITATFSLFQQVINLKSLPPCVLPRSSRSCYLTITIQSTNAIHIGDNPRTNLHSFNQLGSLCWHDHLCSNLPGSFKAYERIWVSPGLGGSLQY
jgi:hypothetical protein